MVERARQEWARRDPKPLLRSRQGWFPGGGNRELRAGDVEAGVRMDGVRRVLRFCRVERRNYF